jgi:hypothetical protein
MIISSSLLILFIKHFHGFAMVLQALTALQLDCNLSLHNGLSNKIKYIFSPSAIVEVHQLKFQ